MENKNSEKKIEGYIDKERNIFVITKDRDGILTPPAAEKSPEERNLESEKMKQLFRENKPEWMK